MLVDNFSSDSSGPKDMDALETPTPRTPRASYEPRPYNPTMETPRQERRRRWQAVKIEESRHKSKTKPTATPAERSGPKVSTSAGSETHDAPHGSQASGTAGGRAKSAPDREASQWKIIREFKICAGCLTRTIPPHKPGDDHAVCTGQPPALWDKAKIAKIRKESDRMVGRIKASGQVQTRTGQHNKQRLPEYAPLAGSQVAQPCGYRPYPGFINVGHGGGYPSVLGSSHVVLPTPANLFALPAQIPRCEGPSSYLHPQARLSRSTQYSRGRVARSESSATQVGVVDELFVAGEPLIARTPQRVQALMTTPTKRSKELDINVMGMVPPTPLITGPPEIHIEDFGPTGMQPEHITAMPDSESSGLVPIVPVNQREWDGETKVPEDALEALTMSASSIEKSLSERKTVLPIDRSWTLKGLLSSSLAPADAALDGSTVVDEPQELAFKNDTIRKEMIRPSQSLESFFAARDIINWLL